MKTMIKNKKTGVVLEGTMDYQGNDHFRFKIDGTSSYNAFETKDWDIIQKVPQNPGAVIKMPVGGYVRGWNGKWADLLGSSEFRHDDDFISSILSDFPTAKVVFEGIEGIPQ